MLICAIHFVHCLLFFCSCLLRFSIYPTPNSNSRSQYSFGWSCRFLVSVPLSGFRFNLLAISFEHDVHAHPCEMVDFVIFLTNRRVYAPILALDKYWRTRTHAHTRAHSRLLARSHSLKHSNFFFLVVVVVCSLSRTGKLNINNNNSKKRQHFRRI